MDLPADLYRAPPYKLKGQVHNFGHVDVADILKLLATRTGDEWAENALRQQQFKVHKDTESIHIPMVTNESVHFFIDDVDHAFKVGDIIEIDNTKYHSVRNNGSEDRIHLIIDYYHA